jgi:DNA modification methylase
MAVTILQGDTVALLPTLAERSVHACVTSPPYYGLRNYGLPPTAWPEISYSPMPGLPPIVIPPMKCCLGLEPTPEAYTAHLVHVYRLVWRVLRDDATAWLNLGDSYAADRGGTCHSAETLAGGTGGKKKEGHPTNRGRHDGYTPTRDAKKIGLKHKDLIMIPHRVAFALQADGWFVRSAIVWAKGVSFCPTYSGSCMPESVTDRPTSAFEMVFLLAKQAKYFYDAEAVKEKAEEASAERYKYDFTGRAKEQRLSVQTMDGERNFSGKRNLRNVFLINPKPFPDAHYAVFPTALVDPMIKASTSEKGCCPVCGAPWERVVDKKLVNTEGHAKKDHTGPLQGSNAIIRNGQGRAGDSVTKTLGWQPTCSCDGGDPVPCTVLDPFSGAGSTGVQCEMLGRNYIGLELSEKYAEMSAERIAKLAGVFTETELHKNGEIKKYGLAT